MDIRSSILVERGLEDLSDSERRFHSDSGDLGIGTLVLGHSLIRSLIHSHRSLIRLLRTARFVRALRCAHSLAPKLVGQWNIFVQFLKGPESLCIRSRGGALIAVIHHLDVVKAARGKRVAVIPVIEEAEFAANGRVLVLVRRREGVAAQRLIGPRLAGDAMMQLLIVLRPG